MEFWGIEVKSGQSVKVDPGEDMIVHISQAALGESKNKGNEPIYLYLNVDNQKFIVGTLTQEKFPQLTTEILLEKGFKLSHSWKNGSVYFTGYKINAIDREGDVSDDADDDDELPVVSAQGNSKTSSDQATPGVKKTDAAMSRPKQENLKVPIHDDDSDEDSDDDTSSSDDLIQDKKVDVGGDSDEDDEDSLEEEDDTSDDEIPEKPVEVKKRPAEAEAPKASASGKKTRFTTPQKTETKKSNVHVHVATPYPAKLQQQQQMGKKAGEGSKQGKGPSSSLSSLYGCKSCERSFTSEAGLMSHTKAKHSAAP